MKTPRCWPRGACDFKCDCSSDSFWNEWPATEQVCRFLRLQGRAPRTDAFGGCRCDASSDLRSGRHEVREFQATGSQVVRRRIGPSTASGDEVWL